MSVTKIKTNLVNLCESWGGKLILKNDTDNHHRLVKQSCPFQDGLGIDFSKKIVSCEKYQKINPGAIIHEMGHVFASRKNPNSNNSSPDDEWGFFGWEWAVAKKVGLLFNDFAKSNRDYLVYMPNGFKKLSDFGSLSISTQSKVLKEAALLSIEKKLIVKGQPVSIR